MESQLDVFVSFCACTCVCRFAWRVEVKVRCLSQWLSLSFETEALTEPGAHQFG